MADSFIIFGKSLVMLAGTLPLSRLNGDFKLSDIMDMLQTFLSMFKVAETPMRKMTESSMFPMPFMPPVPPVLPMFPMPFWGWNKGSGKRARRERDESTASDADDSAEGNTVETADNSADNTDK